MELKLDVPESQLLAEVRSYLGQTQGHFIGGGRQPSQDGATYENINPATGEALGEVARGSIADVDRAVTVARDAFERGPWKQFTPGQRSSVMWRIADLMEQHADILAQLETLDQGKPLVAARTGDVAGAIETFRYTAGWATKLTGDTIPVGQPGGFHAYTKREPIGVVGQIVPWNFPLAMAAWKIAPALAAGCTIVLKPAEQTPLTALYLADLCKEAGLPDGVLNVVTGFGHDVGAAIVNHPGIDKIAFTGSTQVGKSIIQAASNDLKRVGLELGGKNASIVMGDADIDQAIPGIVQASFGNSGQICTSPSRILVQRAAVADVERRLAEAALGITVGHGFRSDVDVGPVISEKHLESIREKVESGLRDGGKLLTGGNRIGDRGFFLEPTVMTGVSIDSSMAQEEIFGPVVNIIPFDDVDDAISLANNTEYGLTAQVWSRDISNIHYLADNLDVGSVWVNGKSMDIALPFGGFKQSGWGQEKGREGVELYTRLKTVVITL